MTDKFKNDYEKWGHYMNVSRSYYEEMYGEYKANLNVINNIKIDR